MAVPTFGMKVNFDPEQAIYEEATIKQLINSPKKPILYGVVIGKSDPRSVNTKRSYAAKYVLNFTLRDSPNDTIYASCWGEMDEVLYVKQIFTIGDVVKLTNVQVVNKRSNNTPGDELFKPFTTSLFELNINPRTTEIEVCAGGFAAMFSRFLNCPVHCNPSALVEITSKGRDMENKSVTLLVAIKNIGPLQEVKSKDGRTLKKLELTVFDQTEPSFQVLIWGEEVANFLLKHCTQKSVLLISDIRMNYNVFSKRMMATAAKNTIFTPNPDFPAGKLLCQYVQTVPTAPMDNVVHKGIDEQQKRQIQVFTVAQLLNKLQSRNLSVFVDTIGYVYGFISHLDIDGAGQNVSTRCPQCKQMIRLPKVHCTNGRCESGSGLRTVATEDIFDLIINITDHTGTLKRCSLFGEVGNNLFECSVPEFLIMSDAEKTHLKWNHMFEKYKFEFRIPHSSLLARSPLIRIVSCTKAFPNDISMFQNET